MAFHSFEWLYRIARSQSKRPTDASHIAHECLEHITKGINGQGLRFASFGDKREIATTAYLMMMFGLVLSTALVYFAVHRFRKRKVINIQIYEQGVVPPLAPGSMSQTISALRGSELPFFFKRCFESVGPIFCLNVPSMDGQLLVAVGDVEVAKVILQDPTTIKPEEPYEHLCSIAGGPNIVSSEGQKWKSSRKGIAQAFSKNHLERMHQVCKDKTEAFIQDKLSPLARSNQPFDLGDECALLTLSIICQACFEYKIKEQEAVYLVQEFDIALREFTFEKKKNPLYTSFGFLLPSVRRARVAVKNIRTVARKILHSYRKNIGKSKPVESLISHIVNNDRYANDDHRIADMIILLLAGYDKTAYSLAWTLLELARNPHELRGLRDALTGNDDYQAQAKLKDVLREGMRVHPVVPVLGVRTAGRDFILDEPSMVIPKGSQILFPTIVLTRNKVDDAEDFRPSRWRKHPETSYLLFSEGRRNCVGQGLALAELTWVLSRLSAEFDFNVVDEGRTDFCSTVKCVGTLVQAKRTSSPAAQKT